MKSVPKTTVTVSISGDGEWLMRFIPEAADSTRHDWETSGILHIIVARSQKYIAPVAGVVALGRTSIVHHFSSLSSLWSAYTCTFTSPAL